MAALSRASFSLLVLLIASFTPLAVLCQSDLAERDVDPNEVRRRAYGQVAVAGDYLYVEGGAISMYINRSRTSDQGALTVNYTYSIPLSYSWSNDSVVLSSISHPDDMVSVNYLGLWGDDISGTLYRWGGENPYGQMQNTSQKTLWKLEADGKGNGTWSATEPANSDIFSTIHSGVSGAAASCNGTGFYIGGFVNKKSEANTGLSAKANSPLPGMLTYDMSSRMWANESSVPLSPPYGVNKRAQAVCTSGVSQNQLVFVLGGSTSSLLSATVDSQLNSLGNISFYDPIQKQWHWQTTTGDTPAPREYFCAAGAASTNGTYEIFIYGGYNSQSTAKVFDDIYVLSIPGFQWFRANTTNYSRRNHACALVGKRQVFVMGGLDDDLSNPDWQNPDEWTQAIGIFDLTDLAWKSGYDANAAAYESPQVIKNWYNSGGLSTVSWSSTAVKSLFNNETTSSSGSGTTPSSSASATSTAEPEKSKTPVGAIAGGVVGGIAGIAIVGVAFFLLRRRRKNSPKGRAELADPETINPPEFSPTTPGMHKASTFGFKQELDSIHFSELKAPVPGEALDPIELDAGQQPKTLPKRPSPPISPPTPPTRNVSPLESPVLGVRTPSPVVKGRTHSP